MSIRWIELDPSQPHLSLASRGDDAVATRGEAVAALVQFASRALNDASLNYAIQRGLLGSKRPSRYFKREPASSRRGLIARAIIGARDNGNGMIGRYLVDVVFGNLYDNPRRGIQAELSLPSAVAAPNPADELELRWFWGRRA